MKKLPYIVFTLLCILLPSQSKNQTHSSYGIDTGSIINDRYSNDFFMMSLSIPAKWYALNDKEKKNLIEKQKQLVNSSSSLKKSYTTSTQRTHYLLVLFQFPPHLPTRYNPSFICIAENIKNKPQIKTGKDYLLYIKRIYQHTKAETKTKIINEEMLLISNKVFDTLSFSISLKTFMITQNFYVTLFKDYALSFVFTYTNKEEKQVQENIIKSILFKQ